jgi:hypothetical protein
MANVYNVTLSRKGLSGGISEMTVTYKVSFNHFERITTENRMRFREYIELWGDDWGLTGSDDYLYRAPASVINSQSSTLTRTRKFNVSNEILDEDWGKDEVFAKVRIIPLLASGDVEKSNNITGWF